MSLISSGQRQAVQQLMQQSGVRFGTSGARGLVSALSPEVCYALTAAFLQTLPKSATRVALAMDLRPSSPTIASACAAAVVDAGLQVLNCGCVPTPALACFVQEQGVPGVMVTGSHIPFDRNGLKFYGIGGEIAKEDEARITGAEVIVPDPVPAVALGPVDAAARQTYLDRYRAFFAPGLLAGMKIGFYEHSSVARDLFSELFVSLGAQLVPLGRSDDFVPIDTEAVSAEDARLAQRWAAEHGFDAIVSTDGDADRPLIGDENGQWLRGDIVGILCARYLAANAVVTTVSCNSAVERCGAFGRVERTRIGSPYVIAAMEALIAAGENAVVGFEPNGGFLVGTALARQGRVLPPLMTRDALLPILCLLAMSRDEKLPLSALPARLPARFTASDRLPSFPGEQSGSILAGLRARFAAGEPLFSGLWGAAQRLDETDGLRVTFASGEVVHLRPSGNAPELRCYAEADSPGRAAELVARTLGLLRETPV